MGEKQLKRCAWAEKSTPLDQKYHDEEWGVPVSDDTVWFEFLTLEGAQAGLSWTTILHKREGYRQAFDGFDYHKIAQYTDTKQQQLRQNPAIVRNKLKIKSTVTNAQAFLQVQQEFGSFNDYIWGFVGGKPIINHWAEMSAVPVSSKESDALSKDLKQRGFKFVGTTICYALMQATGLVFDHTTDCFCYAEREK
ncbi:DNA-3-methyladenine glycosylase I [Marinicella sp. S1101]|uniref:DNA-3-methyladenine glycosylase I n=1 Tax=Marinicella marina TaxID=2996016 RepID=UPI002260D899|nr:DNA-3-methyladenine glycosylase I [Marinicella marina]MCX7553158.1 DNA-3-methyladenine glycosylase I [Marinicella marina]MDJ1138890.1 DNA-3-methyladenine glycosylase I [Marinicella marina]